MNTTAFTSRIVGIVLMAVFGSNWASAEAPRRISDGDLVEVSPRKAGDPLVLYVNGIDVKGEQAVMEAEEVARYLGSATLIFNDCSQVDPRRNSYRDLPAMLISKGGGYFLDKRVNKAGPALMRTLRSELAAGREVHLVTFSMGSMIALNVLNELEASIPRRDRARRMGLIRWVSLGGAIFGPGHFASDGYPSHLGGMVRLDDVRDGVSARWGGLDFSMASDSFRHLIWNYAPYLTASLFDGRLGQIVVDGPNRILLDEIVKGGPNPPRILVRVFPVPGQTSRATVNFDVPKAWGTDVEVTIVDGARGQFFTWMDDCSGWFDSSVSRPLTSGSKTRISSDGDYLGRISWDPSVEDKSNVQKREFMVEFRPAKS